VERADQLVAVELAVAEPGVGVRAQVGGREELPVDQT
jgi:hypothetical protein